MYDLAGFAAVLQTANKHLGRRHFLVAHSGFDGSRVASDANIDVPISIPPQLLDRTDQIIIFAGENGQHYQNPKLLSWLRLQHRRGLHLSGIDIGAFVLARCGLLDGIEATTHWRHMPGFKERFPKVLSTEKVFCVSGQISTSAGRQAATDLAVHMIAQSCGAAVAQNVADDMLFKDMRGPEAPQRSLEGGATGNLHPHVRAAIHLIEENVNAPLTVPQIAARIGISQRQLERQFAKDTHSSIVQFSLLKRLDHACELFRSTGLSILETATACGFNSVSHFTTAFRKHKGMTPGRFRTAIKQASPTAPAV